MENLEQNKINFLKMTAAFNAGQSDFENADIDDSPFTENSIVVTHENIGNFPVIADSKIAKLFVAENFQAKKAMRRGDLFIADFGDYRLVAFTGEGI